MSDTESLSCRVSSRGERKDWRSGTLNTEDSLRGLTQRRICYQKNSILKMDALRQSSQCRARIRHSTALRTSELCDTARWL